jgi:uncharacterized phosphosugar-binding protein
LGKELSDDMPPPTFIDRLQEILQKVLETQDSALDAAARRMADAVEGGGLVHLFGSGHSVIPVMDAFPRYGSFVGFNPLTDPRLMWSNVLGPGGVQELLWLERTEGYVERFLSHEPIGDGDVLVVFSHGGRNAAPVEAAMYGRARGAAVVGVTSGFNVGRPASHSSGKRLVDVSDVVVDTLVPVEDALVTIDGWGTPLAGASTIVACACVGEFVTRTAARLMERGVVAPTFVSPTVPGRAVESNDEVFRAHERRLLEASARGG